MPQTFNSLGAFAAHLRLLASTAGAAEHRAVDKGSEILLDAVKGVIGNYQSEPTVWPALAEATVEDRVRHGFTPDEPLRRTGGFADSFEREVLDHDHAVVGTSDERARAFEYGFRNMPARPVMAAADAQQGEHIAHAMARIIHNHLAGHRSEG